MKKERRIGFLAAVMVMSAALFSACGTINLPCLLGDCPTADKCGNGVVDSGETCDIAIAAGQPGACPVSCGDGNPCTSGMLVNPGTCTAMCSILPCACGNGVVDTGETCDTAIPAGQPGACPTNCTAPDACTTSTLQNAGTCTAQCVNAAITPCCGNGVVETGEECEPPNIACCDSACRMIPCCASFLSGTWITRLTTTGTITAPSPVGTLTGASIDVVQRMVISNSSGTQTAKVEICALSTTATSPIPFSVDYSAAVLASLTGSASEAYKCYQVGDTVAFPSFTINSGWGGSLPVGCLAISPIPTYSLFDCPCGMVDSDGDGICGITLTIHLVNGALNLTAYAGLTMNISMANMVLTDANTISGTTSFPINGYIFGSTDGATGVLNVVPNSSAVPVTLIKLPGDVPCATVLTHCTGATCVP